jgi:hypothetical protein
MTALFRNVDFSDAAVIAAGVALVNVAAAMILAGSRS